MAIKKEAFEFVNYLRRRCYVCGQKVPKNTGLYSMGSFRIVHDGCFSTLQSMATLSQ